MKKSSVVTKKKERCWLVISVLSAVFPLSFSLFEMYVPMSFTKLEIFSIILFPSLLSVVSFVGYLAAKQDRLDSQTVYGRYLDKSGKYVPPGKRSTADMVFLSSDFGSNTSSSSCDGSSSSGGDC
jgi:hypothetical protein